MLCVSFIYTRILNYVFISLSCSKYQQIVGGRSVKRLTETRRQSIRLPIEDEVIFFSFALIKIV